MTNQAKVTEHAHTSGRSFWMVACQSCCVVLNSGHHYTDPGSAATTQATHHCTDTWTNAD